MSQQYVPTGTILDKILARTTEDTAERRRNANFSMLTHMIADRPRPIAMADALRGDHLRVIAEIKRASPSKGRFPVEIDPAAVATDYIAGGASAISVLTDNPFFGGSLADLREVATVAHGAGNRVPVLRKDFVVDEFQLLEALAYGADAALLIVAALEQRRLRELMAEGERLGLSLLVEVHDEAEMARALDAGATLVGINNRDLHTFVVDLVVTERVAPMAPSGVTLVGESGIFTEADAQRMADAGVDALLVGESLIVAPDRAAALGELTGVRSARDRR